MKTAIGAVVCAVLLACQFFENDFQQQLTAGEYYCFSITPKTNDIARTYGLDASDILPIVYPECARYSAFSNVAESTVLEYYYIKGGSQSADFSVGRFQMKPSFAEALEEKIASETYLMDYKERFAYNSTDQFQREERLDRLLDEDWQIHYLCCFYLIVQHESSATIAAESESLTYMAAAYNYGFTQPIEEIVAWSKVSAFPNGLSSGEQNYNYTELAQLFHQKMTRHETN